MVTGTGATGEERANRFLVLLLGLQRLSYLVPVAVTLSATAYRSAILNVGLFALTLLWNGWVFWRVRQAGWFPRPVVWVDVGWAAFLIVAVGLNSPAGPAGESLNWSTRMGQAASALAGAAITPVRLAVVAVAALLAVHAFATLYRGTGSADPVAELVGCLNGLLWFAVVIGYGARYLRRQGQRLDELNRARLAAESRRAADQAWYAARLSHFRALHDTVLTTLTAIARGGLDHRSDQVRQRCAQDAGYIRRMLADTASGGAGPADDGLAARLAGVVAGAEALGLSVTYRHDESGGPLPGTAVDALGDATREALNNVLKHAGVGTAWVTMAGVDGTTVVRVVDRGRGFDPARTAPGFGLRHSVAERLRAAGGSALVTGVPDEGTCVELRWPA